ncbi:casparian strip membrane protein 1-like [Andrographis paniculata]|uniref:casparian strip membrane protein 1-like n=1 Tax=Andrographis paniculata TaxID=175694 RepID=UPI0021E70444|nr:casparian strip membrane protein 1-like [Andrographis paniculata]
MTKKAHTCKFLKPNIHINLPPLVDHFGSSKFLLKWIHLKKMKPEEQSVGTGIRGASILDLIFRVLAVFGTLGSALAMATTDQTLPFSTQAVLFQAQYDDIPTFRFFVITNGVVCGYLALSLPLSIYHVVRTRAARSRVILTFLDAVMIGVLAAGASAATAIVYLAHKGNASANWLAICRQYQTFCERIRVSLIGSFAAVLFLVLSIPLSSFALYRQRVG